VIYSKYWRGVRNEEEAMSRIEKSCGDLQIEIGALLEQELDEHRQVFEATANGITRSFTQVLLILESALRQGGKLLLFGNGGSAADAQHIAAELVIRYKHDRPAIAAIALTTDSSALTACGNDMGFEAIFERQIEALGRSGDVAIGISTSGKSPNVLKGLRQARAMDLRTIGLSGGTGGEMPGVCDAVVVIPSSVTARIQEMHITVGHMLCKALEQRLGLV
jgi:D-sedoheptulose 7-phosphate isomerase